MNTFITADNITPIFQSLKLSIPSMEQLTLYVSSKEHSLGTPHLKDMTSGIKSTNNGLNSLTHTPMIPSNNIIQQFLTFLYNNNALKPYKDNMLKSSNHKLRILNPFYGMHNYNGIISSAFVWSETPQGHTFWDKLDNEWHHILINIKHL